MIVAPRRRGPNDWIPAFAGMTHGYNRGMEADRLNLIQNSLQDLAARSAELRRYL